MGISKSLYDQLSTRRWRTVVAVHHRVTLQARRGPGDSVEIKGAKEMRRFIPRLLFERLYRPAMEAPHAKPQL